MSMEEAARPVGLSKTILSRLETGGRNISPDEVAGLLAIYGVTGEERDRLLNMARSADEPGWWEVGIPGMTKESATLADYESTAVKITDWAPMLVPGLLQTMDYARAFMQVYQLPREVIESRLIARLRRQQTMWRPDVEYTAFLGEAALLAEVGGPAVMGAQLHALLETERRPNIELRIVPMRTKAHLGQIGGFLLLEFPQASEVVHVELAASGTFHDEPPLTDSYVRAVAQLNEVAASATESTRRIEELAAETGNR
jgi:hypothetical protein